ncbi:hypothetical protein HPP92_010244 [Vanilla planifolia]|uniref:Phosphotyrosine protein phosphatase domain-containing protein n=1 Tax=Vanilla planifolia TaxID=51239 RepID=A0A835QY80_VANPL|nr:hypothetical protein HPP92_010244 [Vanilla planifolia]
MEMFLTPGIGRARRMQVPNVMMQHNVKLEALAATTIAQRGVQLVGTAHGITIESIIKNPSLQVLSVTLGDDEAKEKEKFITNWKPLWMQFASDIHVFEPEFTVHLFDEFTVITAIPKVCFLNPFPVPDVNFEGQPSFTRTVKEDPQTSPEHASSYVSRHNKHSKLSDWMIAPILVYVYRISEAVLLQVAKVMGLEDKVDTTNDIRMANVVVASNSEMKENPWIRSMAKYYQLPVFVIKEVRLVIEYIVIPGGEPVELLPRCSEIIARQLELIESYQLAAEKSGTELNSRLQILPMKINRKE